jgi:hypothetical protein
MLQLCRAYTWYSELALRPVCDCSISMQPEQGDWASSIQPEHWAISIQPISIQPYRLSASSQSTGLSASSQSTVLPSSSFSTSCICARTGHGARARVRVYTYIHTYMHTQGQLWPTGSVGPGAQGQ